MAQWYRAEIITKRFRVPIWEVTLKQTTFAKKLSFIKPAIICRPYCKLSTIEL